MLRLFSILLLALMVACTSAPATQAPPDPAQLINEAIAKMRAAKTVRISVDESGPDYQIFTNFATVFFRHATAQYVAPATMQATVRVVAAGLPLEVQVFSVGTDQWFRAIWTGNKWLNQKFAPDFNPEMLISEQSGFQAALKALIQLTYVSVETLENGEQVYHLSASANGPDIAALFGGLIEPVGVVGVEVYIDTTTHYPARFIVNEIDSPFTVTAEAGKPANPIVWTIDLSDINAAPVLSTPEALSVTESATSEAAPQETPVS